MTSERKKELLSKLDEMQDAMLWFAENLDEYGEEQQLWCVLTKDHGISASNAVDMRNMLDNL